jgi:spermidine/putrescine-binding protein
MDTDPAVTIGSVLLYLGYSRNSEVESELAQAGEFLKDAVIRNRLRFMPSIEVIESMKAGEICVSQAYNGDASFVMADSPDVGFFIPKEGSDLYFDVMAIPRDAKHKAAAEAFINYVLRPDVHAAITDYTGYPSPNRAAIEQGYIDEEVLSDPVIYPDTAGLESWSAFDGERRALWNRTWAEVQRTLETIAGG